jgi:hypothetical protein
MISLEEMEMQKINLIVGSGGEFLERTLFVT